ncbi:hypothetical protein OF83DRAFT_1086663 [Amylostereum chailletii]|nr:hypothetical protein OF83DRAFT_1086663 [Amylostereum chailletii]
MAILFNLPSILPALPTLLKATEVSDGHAKPHSLPISRRPRHRVAVSDKTLASARILFVAHLDTAPSPPSRNSTSLWTIYPRGQIEHPPTHPPSRYNQHLWSEIEHRRSRANGPTAAFDGLKNTTLGYASSRSRQHILLQRRALLGQGRPDTDVYAPLQSSAYATLSSGLSFAKYRRVLSMALAPPVLQLAPKVVQVAKPLQLVPVKPAGGRQRKTENGHPTSSVVAVPWTTSSNRQTTQSPQDGLARPHTSKNRRQRPQGTRRAITMLGEGSWREADKFAVISADNIGKM